ncbi:hypothetical protein HJC23_002621 [Cyclotella cryptica]|uniref:Secreted protein n=1 Tax=Cyclotella cryptica TaxID=29204 RepID=A0ABD3PYK6_9STRA|eukprot:CCRYP_010378-RA/>CCRYP_010378-RA protein AED:0.03 eAED:0.03 QI:243/1/1/1/1/1/2/198/276
MKLHFIITVGVALLRATPIVSVGIRSGYAAPSFEDYSFEQATSGEDLDKAKNNDSLKQCKKQCDRTYNKNSRANNRCRSVCDSSYQDWNYFPSGGKCKKRCEKNSDCQVGGYNPCGSCGQYVGSEMYQLCYAPKPAEEEDTSSDVEEVVDVPEFFPSDLSENVVADFLEHRRKSGNTCGIHCHKNSDCYQGGVVQCGVCNQVQGTYGYHTCIEDSSYTPAPSPWNYFPDGGECSHSCESDSDCQKGGFNPCGSCGQSVGTLMYLRCFAPNPNEIDE